MGMAQKYENQSGTAPALFWVGRVLRRVFTNPPQGNYLQRPGQKWLQLLHHCGLGRGRVGGHGLVVGPGGREHEYFRRFALLEEVVMQAAGFEAHQGHEFEQELLHLWAVRRLAPNSDGKMTFGVF